MLEEAKWHWAEGIKFAIEATKTLFILNGAAAIAVLTFLGNTKMQSGSLVMAMVCFALGSSMGGPMLGFAYLTQLYYGRAFLHEPSASSFTTEWGTAVTWQRRTYFCAIVSLGLFLAGLGVAACGFYTSG